MTQKTIILANPRGFCAGVDRAISIVERALEEFGAKKARYSSKTSPTYPKAPS